jgi:hypothetical protein
MTTAVNGDNDTAVMPSLPLTPVPGPDAIAMVGGGGTPPKRPRVLADAVTVASPGTLNDIGDRLHSARRTLAAAAEDDAASAKEAAIELLAKHDTTPICTLDPKKSKNHHYHINITGKSAWDAVLTLVNKCDVGTKKEVRLYMLCQGLPFTSITESDATFTATFPDGSVENIAAQKMKKKFFNHRGHGSRVSTKALSDAKGCLTRLLTDEDFGLSSEEQVLILTTIFRNTPAANPVATE